jgi:hypothetical protein
MNQDQISKMPRSSAERMRLYRRRRSRGSLLFRIDICPAEVDALEKRGYLDAKDRESRNAIERAANSFLSDALGGFL